MRSEYQTEVRLLHRRIRPFPETYTLQDQERMEPEHFLPDAFWHPIRMPVQKHLSGHRGE